MANLFLRGETSQLEARMLSYELSHELEAEGTSTRILNNLREEHAATNIDGFTATFSPGELIYAYDPSSNVQTFNKLIVVATNESGRSQTLPVRNTSLEAPSENGVYRLDIQQDFGKHGSVRYEGKLVVTTDRLVIAKIAVDALLAHLAPLDEFFAGELSGYKMAEGLVTTQVMTLEATGKTALIPIFESLQKLPDDKLGATAMVYLYSKISGVGQAEWSTVSEWLAQHETEARRVYEGVKARH